jgi:hypothetical protein
VLRFSSFFHRHQPPDPLALSDKNLGEIAVFDDAFIGQNVYSGLTVEADHRQNLHELILGSEGIALNNAPQEAVDRIEEHNRALTGSRNTIRRDGRHDDRDHQHLRGVSSRCRRSPGPNKARARYERSRSTPLHRRKHAADDRSAEMAGRKRG